MVPNRRTATAFAGIVALVAGGAAVLVSPGASASDWTTCVEGTSDRQTVFARSSSISGVPQQVLLAVSFMESRWDAHGASPSTSGGYGPMHLTDVDTTNVTDVNADRKGEEASDGDKTDRQGTIDIAADLTGVAADRLRKDDVANICGGAAVLAAYQAELAPAKTQATRPSGWTKAIAKYSAASDEAAAKRFTAQVFDVIRDGRARTTNDGYRLALKAAPAAKADQAAIESMGLAGGSLERADCPRSVGCETIPAPYEWYGEPNPGAYGNHDLANRQAELDIDYIIIHDTEATWDTTLQLVQNPRYVSWQYSLRSSDGHIAQHVDNRNVAWHAGNWYTNMHSIGLEHEGFAAHGADWYTESMYQTSAKLVRYLAAKYDVPLDRGHVIGHDQIPGITPANVRGMHWDPGPYWDWEHYFDLLGAPIDRDKKSDKDVVVVAPGFERNQQLVTGCDEAGVPCERQGTNFAYLHTAPSEDAPLVKDAGLHPDGSYSTTEVWDIGARAAAGQKFRVDRKQGKWLGVWYLGEIAWLKKADTEKARGDLVVASGAEDAPVYGRAYPEESAYPEEIPYQPIAPLQYTIKPGQAYVLADDDVSTDYYYAKTYDDSLPGDHTVVSGEDEYYQIWFGHRIAYVRAADVRIRK